MITHHSRRLASAVLVGAVLATAGAAPTLAAPPPGDVAQLDQLTNEWRGGAVSSVLRGDTLTNVVKVNFNTPDGTQNAPIEKTVTFTVENGSFMKLPGNAVAEKSSISSDGTTMTVVVSDRPGTAMVIETSVVADGAAGTKLTLTAEVDGTKKTAPGVSVTEKAGVDIIYNWGTSSGDGRQIIGSPDNPDYAYDYGFPIALSVPKGSGVVADTVTFDIEMTSTTNTHVRDESLFLEWGDQGRNSADIPRNKTGVLEKGDVDVQFLGGGRYRVTWRNFPTDPAKQALLGADGKSLGVESDRIFLAAGEFRIGVKWADVISKRINPNDSGSRAEELQISQKVTNVKFASSTGTPIAEDTAANNSNSVVLIPSGTYTASIGRNSRGDIQGTNTGASSTQWGDLAEDNMCWRQSDRWSAQCYLVPGDTFYGNINHASWNHQGAAFFLDTQHAEFTGDFVINLQGTSRRTVQYTTDRVSDLRTVDIDGMTWTTGQPSDWSKVTGIRTLWSTPDLGAKNIDDNNRSFYGIRVKSGVSVGDDIWVAGYIKRMDGNWNVPGDNDRSLLTETPGMKYPGTTTQRDVAVITGSRVSSQTSFADKEVDAGEETTVTGTASWESRPGSSGRVDVVMKLDAGLTYTSADKQPTNVQKNSDGTTTLTWANQRLTARTPTDYVVTVTATGTENDAPTGGYRAETTVTNKETNILSDSATSKQAVSSADTAINFDGTTGLMKQVTQAVQEAGSGDLADWKLTVQNRDSIAQAKTDVIDVLPYNGGLGSSFSGGYSIGNVSVSAGVKDAKIYYTSADPKTLSTDPEAQSNGGFATPSSIWSTTKPAKVTGIRVVTGELGFNKSYSITIPWTPDDGRTGNRPGDVYVNNAGARATNTELLMFRAAKSSVNVAAAKPPRIEKIVNHDVALKQNGKVSYTVKVTNDTGQDVDSVWVTELMGDNLANVAYGTPSKGTISGNFWDIGTMKNGEVATVTVTGTIAGDWDGKQQIVNRTTVNTPSYPGDGDNCETQCAEVPIEPASTLQVDKALDDPSGIALVSGKRITYTVQVKHTVDTSNPNAALRAADVKATDLGGQGLSDIKFEKVSKGTMNAGVWSIGEMADGEVVTATVSAAFTKDAEAKRTFENAVNVGNPTNPAPKSGKPNTGDVTTDDDQFDSLKTWDRSGLQVDKAVKDIQNLAVVPGTEFDYQVTIKNPATEDKTALTTAGNVRIEDVAGPGIDNVRFAQVPRGTIKDGVWTIPDLKPGEVLNATVRARFTEDAATAREFTNFVHGSTPTLPKTNEDCEANVGGVETDTDRCDVVTIKDESKLQVDKAINNIADVAVVPGDTVRYTVQVHNPAEVSDTAATAAGQVKITDIAGQGLENPRFVEVERGTVADGMWSIDALKAGETLTATVEATFTEEAAANREFTNFVIGGTPTIPEPKNTDECEANEGDVTTDADLCDVVVTKDATDLKIDKLLNDAEKIVVRSGDEVTYTVTVKNSVENPDAADQVTRAAHVTATDAGGPGLEDVRFTKVSDGETDGETWSIGELAPNEVVTAQVTATLTGDAEKAGFMNWVSVENPVNPHENTDKCEVNTGDVDTDTDQCDGAGLEDVSDLAVDKESTDVPGAPGETITYRVTAKNIADPGDRNAGLNSTARDVVVTDFGGELLDNVEISAPSKGEIVDGRWLIDELAAGEEATATVTATVKDAGDVRNTVTIANPSNPKEGPTGQCEPNDGVDADTDQCDATSDRVNPQALPRTGGEVFGAVLAAIVMLGAGVTAVSLSRRSAKH